MISQGKYFYMFLFCCQNDFFSEITPDRFTTEAGDNPAVLYSCVSVKSSASGTEA